MVVEIFLQNKGLTLQVFFREKQISIRGIISPKNPKIEEKFPQFL